MYCSSSLTRPSMVASLSRDGKILKGSAVAPVGLNHLTVTRHITLASLKASTASIRFRLDYERYWDWYGLPGDFRFPSTLVPGPIFGLSKPQIPLKHGTTSAFNWDLGINVPLGTQKWSDNYQDIRIMLAVLLFEKMGTIMLLFSTYAKNYASTIYRSLTVVQYRVNGQIKVHHELCLFSFNFLTFFFCRLG